MRKIVIIIAIVFSAMALNATSVGAETISPESAKRICSGKPRAGSGCAWCGKVNCTYVACDTKNKCSLVIVRQGPRRTQ